MATTQKLIVEVVDAKNLVPKDGHGTSSPYVVIDYYGQRKKTHTAIKDLNPSWNEVLEFNVAKKSEVFGDVLELDVYHDKNYGPTRRNNSLGRIRLSSGQFVRKGEEALIYYPLERKYLLSWIQGEIGLKIYYVEAAKPEEPKAESAAAPPAEAAPIPESDQKPAADANGGPPPGSDQAPPPGNEDPQPQQENGAAEAAKPAEEPNPQATPQDAGGDQVDPQPMRPPPDPEDDIVREPTAGNWPPQQEIMAATVSGPMPEIRVARTRSIPPPQPMSRPGTPASYTSDLSELTQIERSSFDLVEKMHYVFVRVVKARSLPTNGRPVAKIAIGGTSTTSKPARKTNIFDWDQTFAFGRDSPDSSSILEVSVWDPRGSMDFISEAAAANFLGGICFDVTEIPLRDPPDSPLAPQWYRLEGGGAHCGDLMLATWVGTQADESFPDAWKTDTAGNSVNSRAKVYLSPKLWYLRATVLEAQDIMPFTTLKEASFQIRSQLGNQVQKTKASVSSNGSPSWNEDLMFVAAEPFSDHLVFSLELRLPRGPAVLGFARIPLTSVERRVDDRKVVSRWFTLEDPNDEKKVYKGRMHLRLCFDGGYHVMDEAAHVCSDYRPTARQLWKSPIGMVELGIIGCKNLLPMKMMNEKGTTDAYTVAKYGSKWVRSRTVSDCLDPKWNEQYTWRVYDPCTVLMVGVFDSWGVFEMKEATRPDFRIGKIRIRISTLETGRVYRNSYPLLLLSNSGVKKMGEIEIAIRFVRAAPTLDMLHVYTQPLLPLMHHIKPLGVVQQEVLRNSAVKIVAAHLSRSEPPLKPEIVRFMLDADANNFSMRKVRANWLRIITVVSSLIDILRWIDDTRSWKNPTSTILVHALLVMLVWFPDLIVPTLAFYVFVIGIWNYRFRPRDPNPHLCPKISQADMVDRDELDEEFDSMPSNKSSDVVRARYDKLRAIGSRVQSVLGDFATQGERMQALVTWRDPRATGIFIGLCFIVAFILYLVSSKMVAMAFGFYYFRHPLFRDRMPPPTINFFRRLPSLCDRVM